LQHGGPFDVYQRWRKLGLITLGQGPSRTDGRGSARLYVFTLLVRSRDKRGFASDPRR
jgi:hypothetical protein